MATHILVVDDETAIADLVEVYLKNEGFTIHNSIMPPTPWLVCGRHA